MPETPDSLIEPNEIEDFDEFSMEEQIDCVRREIDFRERVLTEFSKDADQEEVEKLRRETAVMKAVHETLQMIAGIERYGYEANLPMLEESRC